VDYNYRRLAGKLLVSVVPFVLEAWQELRANFSASPQEALN
jgi:hypothetical protein